MHYEAKTHLLIVLLQPDILPTCSCRERTVSHMSDGSVEMENVCKTQFLTKPQNFLTLVTTSLSVIQLYICNLNFQCTWMQNYDPIRQEFKHFSQGQGKWDEINTAEIVLSIFINPWTVFW